MSGFDARVRRRAAILTAIALAGAIAVFVLPDGQHRHSGANGAKPRPSTTAIPPRIVPYSPGSPSTAPDAVAPDPHTDSVASPPSIYKRVRWTFDTGRSGWVGAGATDAVAVRAPVLAGTGALGIRNNSPHTQTIVAASGGTALATTPARPGMRVFGGVAVRAGSAARAVNVTVTFLDSDGRRIDKAAGQTITDASNGWQQVYDAVGIAPPATAYAMLQLSVKHAAPGEMHYVDNATLDEYPGGSADVAGPLHTADNLVVDALGRTVVLRGFTRDGLEGADADPPTNDDIAHAKAWGANVIRLPLGEQYWLASSCHYRYGYAAQVDDAVRMVTSRGMVALLDLHWNSLKPCGTYSQQPMADYPGAITFWQQVANRYKNNPLVAFDLYNEPHDISDAIWLSGGQVNWHGVSFRAAGMQQMFNAVRSTGARNLVFVSGNNWGNTWPSTGPLNGVNIVYGIHAYTCPTDPPPHCNNASPYDPGQFFDPWLGMSRNLPVAITEFGWPDPEDGRYLSAVIHYAEQHGWGWTVYTWGNATWGPFSLLATAGPGRAYEPRPSGEAVLAALPNGYA